MDILMMVPASIIVFALGASVGSFINVVVYRLPEGLSILWPPSRCPHCLNQLKAYDNVPVFGWLWLKGRCRFCKNKISPRYPVVEAMAGLLFLLLFFTFKFSFLTLGYWAFCSWLLALSIIDWDTMTLPNPLTQSGLLLGIGFQVIWGSVSDGNWQGAVNHGMMAIAAAVLGIWLFDAIAILGEIGLGKAAMGAGDAKLAAMMGAWFGWQYLLLASFTACVVGVLFAIVFRQQWGQKMPFGPFLAMGSVIVLFTGEAVLSTYLRLFFTN
ncbi:prepilin peptidase [Calothrix rhizosoleniae]|uniref:prepilin peptidase n=1 Tax=Calothrix rhizosoleniae TaxID=888997 RepID=UPI000B4A3FDD|nr:A24 family peptidase [Calothrix rhizosoleniae]